MSGRLHLPLLLILLALPMGLDARTWYIEPGGTGDAPTIQAGIDSAAAADTVLLASGTFSGTGNEILDYSGKAITVCSETGNPEDCIIDCVEYGGHIEFTTGEGPGSVLDGITFRHGRYAVECSQSTPTIRNCIFQDNGSTWLAGGMVYYEAGGVIRGCRVRSNAGRYAGGIMCSGGCYSPDLRIVDCVFEGNHPGDDSGGGAIYCEAAGFAIHVDSCMFHDNYTTSGGGAVCLSCCECGGDEVVFADCTFWGNSAVDGGAVGIYLARADFARCTFYGNSADIGSAIAVGDIGNAFLYRCIIAYNQGGEAIAAPGPYLCPVFPSCTDIYGNEGGDWVGGISEWFGVNGNFSACPSFCNADVEPYDFRLCDTSPCAPGNHPDSADCGLIGAWPVGCTCAPSSVEPASSTWGAIKGMYR